MRGLALPCVRPARSPGAVLASRPDRDFSFPQHRFRKGYLSLPPTPTLLAVYRGPSLARVGATGRLKPGSQAAARRAARTGPLRTCGRRSFSGSLRDYPRGSLEIPHRGALATVALLFPTPRRPGSIESRRKPPRKTALLAGRRPTGRHPPCEAVPTAAACEAGEIEMQHSRRQGYPVLGPCQPENPSLPPPLAALRGSHCPAMLNGRGRAGKKLCRRAKPSSR
jgi:hypothetical protein